MKKIVLIALLFTYGCYHTLTKQQRAEEAVKKYILAKNPKVNVKDLKFTQLEDNNIIGVMENKTVYDSNHQPVRIRVLYYTLNADLTKAECCFTN